MQLSASVNSYNATVVQDRSEFALVVASHGYICGVHMNECTLLNNVMGSM